MSKKNRSDEFITKEELEATNSSTDILNWYNIKKISSNPILNGFASIVTLIGGIRSSDLWIKIITILLSLSLMFHALYIIRQRIRENISKFCKMLTIRFIQGLIVGILIGAFASPFLIQPALPSFMSLISPKIEFNGSWPANEDKLPYTTSGIRIEFKKSIPWPYYKFITVNVSPKTSVGLEWSDEHQILYITAKEIYPLNEDGGVLYPRFEYNTTYEMQINGPSMTKPINLKFHTPSKEN